MSAERIAEITYPQKRALIWLWERGGTGVWGKDHRFYAQGTWAPIDRRSFMGLEKAGFIHKDGKRLSLTADGQIKAAALHKSGVAASDYCGADEDFPGDNQ